MKIALDTYPLSSLHSTRGIGMYTDLLTKSLKEFDENNEYLYAADNSYSQVDLIHHPYFDLFRRTLTVNNTKTVVTVHDVIPLKYPEQFPRGLRGRINLFFQKKALQKAQVVITDSQSSKKDIVHFLNIPEKKVQVIHLSVSPSYKYLTPGQISKLNLDKYKLPEEFILYVGDVNWNKNIPGLIEAFSLLTQERNLKNIHLVMVGSVFNNAEQKEIQEIYSLISNKNIKDKVLLLGFVPTEDLVGIYNKASVYVQPSFDEGFGLPPLEALSCGTLVAVARRGSLPEIIGKHGNYFDPFNILDMKKAIYTVLTLEPIEMKKRIDQGLKHSATFTAQKFARETIAVYEKVFTLPY
jgi:glycosyltransferase involved in cell wall biosynthesis